MNRLERIKQISTKVHRLEVQLETIREMAGYLSDAEELPVRYEMKILPEESYRVKTNAVSGLRSLLGFDLDSGAIQHQFDRGINMIADLNNEEALIILQALVRIREARRTMLKAELENLLENSL